MTTKLLLCGIALGMVACVEAADEPLGFETQEANVYGAQWAGGVVYYEFGAGFDPGVRAEIVAAAQPWTAAGVAFVERTTQSPYLTIDNIPGAYQRSSYVGYGGRGGFMQMQVGYDGTTHDYVHEWGHVLGLLHEHCHPRRAQYATLRGDLEGECQARNASYGGYEAGPYDFDSVMHYDAFARDSAGNPAEVIITPLDGRDLWSFGFTESPSAGDLAAVRGLYPSIAPQPTCGNWIWTPYAYFCEYYVW